MKAANSINSHLGVADLGHPVPSKSCAACFTPGPHRFVWRTAKQNGQNRKPPRYPHHDEPLCAEHAAERKGL